jgi:DNA-binding NarL/FixJ family response regulator
MREVGVEEDLRVVIVDDHEFAREAVAAMLDAEPGITIVGQAGSVGQAIGAISHLEPDIAIVDLNMPDGSGREVVEHCRAVQPTVRCIIFTSSVDRSESQALLDAGAEAVVLKSLRSTDLLDAIHGAKAPSPDQETSAIC